MSHARKFFFSFFQIFAVINFFVIVCVCLQMLLTDIALKTDAEFNKTTTLYAEDEAKFFADFAAAFQKLQELGYSDLKSL